jgi:hypothetical protein
MSRLQIVKVLAAPVAAVALVLGLASAAYGNPPRQRGTTDTSQVSSGQLAADAVADHLDALVAATHAVGFAGEEVLPTVPGLDVYWHGRLPALVNRTMLGASRTSGVVVRFLPAPYSLAQLIALRTRIISEPGFATAGISTIMIYPQATGLYIGVSHGSAAARRLPAIAASAIGLHYYPAAVMSAAYGAPAVASSALPGRYKDTPPFWGGDFISSSYKKKPIYCSSGFGVHFANAKHTYFMLTAAHCVAHDELGTQLFKIMGNGKDVGTTFSLSENNDTVSLATASGVHGAGGGNKIYTGNTSMKNSHGQGSAYVMGAAAVHAGDVVEQSGAWSGQRTQIKVKTTEAMWVLPTLDGYTMYIFGAYSYKANHSNAAGEGDSGGPVFINVKGGVKAVGIVSAIGANQPATCTGIREKNRYCSWVLYFPLMTGTSTSILTEMNLALNTK